MLTAAAGALEAGTQPNPGEQTRLFNEAAMLRAELWARFAAVKAGAGFNCAAQQVACDEVELVHAGNEFKEQGRRHANPYIQIEEDYAQNAQTAAVASNPAPAAPVAACAAGPAPACVPAPATEKLGLAADALFKFDKSSLADLLPEGRRRIGDMMEKLSKVYAHIERISLTGYTDRLGGVAYNAYNQALSERRASTIRQYIQSKGYAGEILSGGRGKADQLVACTGVRPMAKLTDCLQPNRRVEIEVTRDGQNGAEGDRQS